MANPQAGPKAARRQQDRCRMRISGRTRDGILLHQPRAHAANSSRTLPDGQYRRRSGVAQELDERTENQTLQARRVCRSLSALASCAAKIRGELRHCSRWQAWCGSPGKLLPAYEMREALQGYSISAASWPRNDALHTPGGENQLEIGRASCR